MCVTGSNLVHHKLESVAHLDYSYSRGRACSDHQNVVAAVFRRQVLQAAARCLSLLVVYRMCVFGVETAVSCSM